MLHDILVYNNGLRGHGEKIEKWGSRNTIFSTFFLIDFMLELKYELKNFKMALSSIKSHLFNPICPCQFFDCCILTDRALKLILYDFSSNFILNMWPVKLFWSVEWFGHTVLFVGDRQRLSLIMELSIHCYTALVLEIGCKFGHLIAT